MLPWLCREDGDGMTVVWIGVAMVVIVALAIVVVLDDGGR